jgi:hypothetical protein
VFDFGGVLEIEALVLSQARADGFGDSHNSCYVRGGGAGVHHGKLLSLKSRTCCGPEGLGVGAAFETLS